MARDTKSKDAARKRTAYWRNPEAERKRKRQSYWAQPDRAHKWFERLMGLGNEADQLSG